MNRYSKGARSERELLNTLYGKGYSVIRSAGSGVNSLSPDLLAIKDGKGIAFECKAWDRDSLALEKEQLEALIEWQRNTKMDTYVAWRMNIHGWFFIKPEEMRSNARTYTVTKKEAMAISRGLESITL